VCFDFLCYFVRNISPCKKNASSYYHKCPHVFMLSTRYFCQTLINLEFSRQIFRKILRYLISWKFASLEPSCSMRTYGETDGQKDMTKPVVAFHNFLKAHNKGDVIILKFIHFYVLQNTSRVMLKLLHSTSKIFTFRLDAQTLRSLYICEVNKYLTTVIPWLTSDPANEFFG